jgi:hypothetical protein
LVPDTEYHEEAKAEAEAEWERLDGLSLAEIAAEIEDGRVKALASHESSTKERTGRASRYEKALVGARAYQPPTAHHEKFKEFMIEQLEGSLDFDCSIYDPPQCETDPQKWIEEKIAKAQKDIGYHAENIATEIARTNSRNRWVAALRESLT